MRSKVISFKVKENPYWDWDHCYPAVGIFVQIIGPLLPWCLQLLHNNTKVSYFGVAWEKPVLSK